MNITNDCAFSFVWHMSSLPELRLMFSLMDRVERGIDEMLHYLEEFIKNQGLADMVASASVITTVSQFQAYLSASCWM